MVRIGVCGMICFWLAVIKMNFIKKKYMWIVKEAKWNHHIIYVGISYWNFFKKYLFDFVRDFFFVYNFILDFLKAWTNANWIISKYILHMYVAIS